MVLLAEDQSACGWVAIKEPPSSKHVLDEAAEVEAEARRAAKMAVQVRREADDALERRLAAERAAVERSEAARQSAEKAEKIRLEMERLRLEAERLGGEAREAKEKSVAAEREVQKCREDEVRLSSSAQELQVVAVAAAAKAKTSVEAAAAAAFEELFGTEGKAAMMALPAHPGEEVLRYPRREEAFHAADVPLRQDVDGPGGSVRTSGMRSVWGTGGSGLEMLPRPATRTEVVEAIDERLVVAVLHGLLQGSRRFAAADIVGSRLPDALLKEAAAGFRARDEASFRAALGQLCHAAAAKREKQAAAELLARSLAQTLGPLVEEDGEASREFMRYAFSEEVLLEGEELCEKMEQWSSEQAIAEYRRQAQKQPPSAQPRLPPSRRAAEMHRQASTNVYSVVQVSGREDGWDVDESALFLNHIDVLCPAKDALEDFLGR